MKTEFHDHLLFPMVVTEQILYAAYIKNLVHYKNLKIGQWICARPLLAGSVLIEKPPVFNSKDEVVKLAKTHNFNAMPDKTIVSKILEITQATLN